MTIVTNTFQTYTAIGQREDLSDIIYNISPTETPFMSGIGKTKATAVNHEWQTDNLSDAAANAQLEGDEVTFPNGWNTVTVRLGNRAQISSKPVIVSGTLDAVSEAGRNSEMAYQISKASKELKRDMEFNLCGVNQAQAAGNNTTARKLAPVDSWIRTNTDIGGGAGANPAAGGGAARTDGTQRAFTEDMLKGVSASCWNNGGEPSMIMVGSFNKQKISEFTGGSTKFTQSEEKKLVASIDVYEGDFGTMQVVPNRFSRSRQAYILQPDMWAVAFLRDFTFSELAKTGDASKNFLLAEYTLESRNEAASGLVADLTTA